MENEVLMDRADIARDWLIGWRCAYRNKMRGTLFNRMCYIRGESVNVGVLSLSEIPGSKSVRRMSKEMSDVLWVRCRRCVRIHLPTSFYYCTGGTSFGVGGGTMLPSRLIYGHANLQGASWYHVSNAIYHTRFQSKLSKHQSRSRSPSR